MSLLKQKNILTSDLEPKALGQSVIYPHGKKRGNSLVIGLTLTSLVDCFTVLIVYLLMTTTIGQEPVDVAKNIELPQTKFSNVANKGPTVVISQAGLSFGGKTFAFAEGQKLVRQMLSNEGELEEMTVQADRGLKYDQINSVIYNLMEAGISKVNLAVYSTPNQAKGKN